MSEYHKIQSVFLRDPQTKYKTFLEGQWARREFLALNNIEWLYTEKVDGTNIRISVVDKRVTFLGRTDAAQIPAPLVNKLIELFTPQAFADLPDLCLYGEGYGAKIQGGGDYIPDGCGFILFDASISGNWQSREIVEALARTLNIPVVPIVGSGSLTEAINLCKSGFKSFLKSTPPEGLVCRPSIELRDRCGERIITKIKLKDFGRY